MSLKGAVRPPTSSKPKKHRLAGVDDVILYTTQQANPVAFLYELECARFSRVNFTLDFSGSRNFYVEPVTGGPRGGAEGSEGEDLVLQCIAEPFRRTRVGRLVLADPSRPAELKNTYNWGLEDVPADIVAQLLAEGKRRMTAAINRAASLNFGDDSATIADIEHKCRAAGIQFIDADFVPDDYSLYLPKAEVASKATLGGDGGASGEAQSRRGGNELVMDSVPIVWRRPSEFYIEGASGAGHGDGASRTAGVDFDVFAGGIEPDDIRQGLLTDCWLMCALSALAEFPGLVTKLFLPESRVVSPAGVYKLRVCKNGIWQIVTIDDCFPCFPGGGPAYSRAHGPELWVLLVEKAYSKLHGCYAAIKMGWAYEAMIDLTGCPFLTVRFEDPDVQEDYRNGELWSQLVSWDAHDYVMSCSTPGEDVFTETGCKPGKDTGSGLVAGHAYTLIAARETSQRDRLVQLRNPWGNFEWTGDWSDHSDKWTTELIAEMGVSFDADDGTFWMAFDDVMKHFFSINVVITHPGATGIPGGGAHAGHHHGHPDAAAPSPGAPSAAPATSLPSWVEKRRKVTFSYGGDDKISTPMYVLSVSRKTEVYLSAHQEDERCRNAKPYLDIGVTVLKIEPTDCSYTLVGSSGNSVERQNQLKVKLQPGRYLVVPTTTGCKFAQGLEDHSGPPVPLFSPAGSGLAASDAADGGAAASAAPAVANAGSAEEAVVMRAVRQRDFSPEVQHALDELFKRLDTDLDGVLSRDELDAFLRLTENQPIDDDVYEWLVTSFDASENPRGLTPQGFRQAYMYMYETSGRDPETIWRDLIYMGYDKSLRLLYARTVVLAVHADNEFEFTAQAYDAEAYEEAMELPIKALGKKTMIEDGNVILYTRRAGYSGVSFAVENRDPMGRTLDFTLDCSLSTNVMSHRRTLVHSQLVPPNETKVMHHLMPERNFEHWSWSIQWGAGWLDESEEQ